MERHRPTGYKLGTKKRNSSIWEYCPLFSPLSWHHHKVNTLIPLKRGFSYNICPPTLRLNLFCFLLDVCEVSQLGLVLHVLNKLPDAVVWPPVGQLGQVVHLSSRSFNTSSYRARYILNLFITSVRLPPGRSSPTKNFDLLHVRHRILHVTA